MIIKEKLCLALLILLFLSPVIVSSCDQMKDIGCTKCHDTRYLDLINPYDDKLSKEDFKVLCDAFSRLNVHVSEGLWKTDIVTADEINVSDRLFQYMLHVIEATNRSDFRPAISVRSGSEPEYPYSCVAYALSHCVGGYSFDDINDWTTQQYHLNGGVPPNRIGEVFSHFWGNDYNAYYSLSSIPNNIEWNYTRTVGVFSTTTGHGHMVNIVGRHSNGDFIVQDFSADTVERYNIWSGAMMGVFVNTSIDSTFVDPAIDPVLNHLKPYNPTI